MRKKQRSFSLMKRRKKLHFSFSKAAIFGLLTLNAEGAVLLGRKRGLFNKFVKMIMIARTCCITRHMMIDFLCVPI